MNLKFKVLCFAAFFALLYAILNNDAPVRVKPEEQTITEIENTNSVLPMQSEVNVIDNSSLVRLPSNIKKDSAAAPVLQYIQSTQEEQIYDNWNLAQYGLPADMVLPFFSQSQASEIVYFGDDETHVILPERKDESSSYQGTLYISTQDSVDKLKQDRLAQSDLAKKKKDEEKAKEDSVTKKDRSNPINKADEPDSNEPAALKENDFDVVQYTGGLRDKGQPFTPYSNDYWASLQGPDYPFNSDAQGPEAMQQRLSSVLSLGHGGSVLLKVKNNGILLNKDGFDFSIFENAFRIAGTNLIFQEFAYVGVSETSDIESFRWFECKPSEKKLAGCAGAVPTAEGGDQFDLSSVGLEKVKYILIKDIGTNKNFPSKWPTEGVDLDAVRLHHAFENK